MSIITLDVLAAEVELASPLCFEASFANCACIYLCACTYFCAYQFTSTLKGTYSNSKSDKTKPLKLKEVRNREQSLLACCTSKLPSELKGWFPLQQNGLFLVFLYASKIRKIQISPIIFQTLPSLILVFYWYTKTIYLGKIWKNVKELLGSLLFLYRHFKYPVVKFSCCQPKHWSSFNLILEMCINKKLHI